MKIPKLATYASTLNQVQLALENGAECLLLEHPSFSIRSYTETSTEPLKAITELVAFARKLKPTIELKLNIDLLFHVEHEVLLSSLPETAQRLEINCIRVQDPGVAMFLKSRQDELQFELALEMGNHNPEGVSAHASFFKLQLLSNELPQAEIRTIMESVPNSAFELQVHGPILLQYSKRPLLSGQINATTPTKRLAEDSGFKNRYFVFYENRHGHFMFGHFDRCLIQSIKALASLKLESWLIDGRGEPEAYLKNALSTYKNERDSYFHNPAEYIHNPNALKALEQVSMRSLKPGFFHTNRTDMDWRDRKIQRNTDALLMGLVLDVIKPKIITLEVFENIKIGDKITFVTPEYKTIDYTVENLEVVAENEESQARLIQLPWKKGIVYKSVALGGSKTTK